MPRFDFKCPSCGAIRKDVWVSVNLTGLDDALLGRRYEPCALCNVYLVRQPAVSNFVIKGFSAKNGYSR